MVEEGGYFQARDMTQRDDQMIPALYRERGQQLSSDGMINVLQGSCYGGSTVINTADCEPTPDAVYEHWRRRYGLDLDARELADCAGARLRDARRAPDRREPGESQQRRRARGRAQARLEGGRLRRTTAATASAAATA